MVDTAINDISAVMDEFIEEMKPGNTARTYFSRLCAFETWLDKKQKDFCQVDKDDINKFLGIYKKAKTINLTIVVLRLFYGWLVEKKIVVENPAKDVKRHKEKRSVPDPFTEDELQTILSTCKGTRFRIPILLMLYSGLRVFESLKMRKSDFWKENEILMLKVVGKGNKERETYISNTNAEKEIEKHLATLKAKERLSKVTENMIEKFARSISVTNFHLHRLRKTFACNIADNGQKPEQIMLLLGHEDFRTTQIYTRFRLDRKQLAMLP